MTDKPLFEGEDIAISVDEIDWMLVYDVHLFFKGVILILTDEEFSSLAEAVMAAEAQRRGRVG